MTPLMTYAKILPMTLNEDTKADIKRIRLEPGDILWVSFGGDLGGGHIWTPSMDELGVAREAIEALVPDGVKVITTDCLTRMTAITPVVDVTRWPSRGTIG